MQKVSKQSLAMIALSILLAISIALTFTFAALTAEQNKATGTITFTGNLAIKMTGFEGKGPTSYTFSVATTDGTIELGDTLTIGISGMDAYVQIAVSAPSGTNSSAVTVGQSKKLNDSYGKVGDSNTYQSTKKIKKDTSVKLNELIELSANLNDLVDESNVTFTVTVDAQVVAFSD